MRKLGQVLGVEAMSLYNHVAGKGDLLDGMIDIVFGEIGLDLILDALEQAASRLPDREAGTEGTEGPDQDGRAGTKEPGRNRHDS